MTALPQGRGLLQPPSRAPPITKTSSTATTTGNGASRAASRARSRAEPNREHQETQGTDAPDTTAAVSLIRRILAPDQNQSTNTRSTLPGIEDALPPLTSSNEVDVQLYAILAIIVKDFVNTWYTQITPDYTFKDEIIRLVAHCSRALEQRLRDLDVSQVLLDELPALLDQHITAYRSARTQVQSRPYSLDERCVYHTLNPHPALDPPPRGQSPQAAARQQENEVVYRQLLVQGALAVLLPTEDLQNTPLRVLLCDILADLIIGQALGGKVCEAWFLHEAIITVISTFHQPAESKKPRERRQSKEETRLEKFGLLASRTQSKSASPSAKYQSVFVIWFWHFMQGIYTGCLLAWAVIRGLQQARRRPRRSRHAISATDSPAVSKRSSDVQEHSRSLRPVLAYRVYGTLCRLILLDHRMPWLTGSLKFLQHVLLLGRGRLATTGSLFDSFLHNVIAETLFPPSIIPTILLNVRLSLFPNNALGPPAPPRPSHEARLQIRRQAASSLLSLIPPIVARTYLATDVQEEMLEIIEEDILDVFSDTYMNKHLIYGIVELIILRLVPELQEYSVSELLAERGVVLGKEDYESYEAYTDRGDSDDSDDRDAMIEARSVVGTGPTSNDGKVV